MLASIHPLGERARRQRWGVTVGAFVAGTVTGSALVGAVLGRLGAALDLPGRTGVAVLVAALAAAGAAADLGRVPVPTVHRQVDERWLDRYRGWVYGAGFGFQLGVAVVTVVSSFSVYLMLALALLTGSAAGGLAVGVAFGAVRGATILAAAGVRHPDQLHRLHRRVQAWAPASRRLTIAVQAAVAAGAVTVLMAR